MTTSPSLAKYYDSYYEDDSQKEWREVCAITKLNNFVRTIESRRYGSLLEVGAGEGSVLEKIASHDLADKYYAAEISSSGIEKIKARGITDLADATLFDGYSLPFEDREIDVVVLSHVLEHVEHPRLLLYELGRVAKQVYIEVPLESTMSLPLDYVFNSEGHLNFYSPRSVRHLVQSSGFRVEKQLVTNPAKEVFVFSQGQSGVIKYHIKKNALALLGWRACKYFTYQSSLLLTKETRYDTESN